MPCEQSPETRREDRPLVALPMFRAARRIVIPISRPAFRTVVFRLHWALGLTAGLVLALVGLTGALMSYEEAVTAYVNRDRTIVVQGRFEALAPAALAARIEAQAPGLRVNALTLSNDPATSVLARFVRNPKTGERPDSVYADPYDGSVLGPVRLEGTFGTVRALHRWLLIPGDGKGWGAASPAPVRWP